MLTTHTTAAYYNTLQVNATTHSSSMLQHTTVAYYVTNCTHSGAEHTITM